jgi:CRP/FNR family transcriptional regulator, cyclic AMP receptor protein
VPPGDPSRSPTGIEQQGNGVIDLIGARQSISHATRRANPQILSSTFVVARSKQTVVSEQRKEAVVALLETGDFFGEGCLTGQPLRLATVWTVTESVIVRIL